MNTKVLKVASVLAWTLLASALAATRIPGTSVSYEVRSSGGKNVSQIFLDSLSDPTGKTYVTVLCHRTPPALLYSRVPLSKTEGAEVTLTLQENDGTVPRIGKFYGKVRRDKQTGQLTVWEPVDKSVDFFWDYVSGEGAPYTLTVNRSGLSPLKLRFNPKGMSSAIKAVRTC